MARIPEHVQEFFEGKLAWVATVSAFGIPNTTPKGSVRIVDDEHIVFADLYSHKTRSNLQEGNRVAITVVDTDTYEGYQVKGCAELADSGPMFDMMADMLKNGPPLKYAVLISVESVYDQSVGPDAGKQIA